MKLKTIFLKRICALLIFVCVINLIDRYYSRILEIIYYNVVGGDMCSDDLFLGVPQSLRNVDNCSFCRKVTCYKLLHGDPVLNESFYGNVIGMMYKYGKSFNNPNRNEYLEILNKSCYEFKKWRGYDLSPITPGEMEDGEPFSVAFNILGHSGFVQTERLFRAIYRPQNSYCFHIDNKSTDLIKDVNLLAKCFHNVFMASTLENVIYAGYSRLKADLTCMDDHLKRKEKWRYLINTAATGFPLKTNKELVEILKIFNGSNAFVTIPTKNNSDLESRFKYKHRVSGGKWWSRNELHSPPPHNLTIIKGSAYGVFSRRFVKFILTDRMAKDFFEWCNETYSPDEHFWQTLHHTYSNPHIHAPGGYTGGEVENITSTYVVWAQEGSTCYGRYVRAVCIFGVRDLPKLVSNPRLFLNKFNQTYQPLAMECMENYLKYKTMCPSKLNRTLYEDLSFVKNKSPY